MLNSLDHCYELGKSAASQGKTLRANPYLGPQWYKDQADAWRRGFSARRISIKENKKDNP